MTNSSFLATITAAPAMAATPMFHILGHARPFLQDSGLLNNNYSSNNNNNNNIIINRNNNNNISGNNHHNTNMSDVLRGYYHGNGTRSGTTLSGTFGTSTTLSEGVGVATDLSSTGPGGQAGDAGSCRDWQDAQHTLFQLANLCVALSFLTPVHFRFHLLFLRCLLLLAFLLLALWAGLLVCMWDVLGWNLVFFLLNAAHVAWRMCRQLPSRLPLSHAAVYAKVFKPVRVTQEEFLDLCQLGTLQKLSKGGLYAMERMTPCGQRLSVLIKGRLKVTYIRLFLHHVEVNQFVDSAEYDAWSLEQNTSDKYQVTIAATEDSIVLTWDHRTLQEYLSSRPFMKVMLHYLIGKDVCSHLYAIQEQLLQAPDYMSALASRHSSMVNVRSCLAGHESSASLSRMADLTGYKQPSEPETSSLTTRPTSSNTVETSV